jgi:hypothetical protein
MGFNTATIIELLNLLMGICIIIISFYASKKFSLYIFKQGWFIVSLSGVAIVIGSVLRAYYSYVNLYLEWAWLGRIFILAHLFLLMIGIYLLAVTAVKMWGD